MALGASKESYPRRYQAEEAIVAAILNRLTARSETVADLREVQTVQRGENRRNNPRMPALWITPRSISVEEGTTITNTLIMEVMVWAEVSDKDPVEGIRRARMLSSIAGEEMIRDEEGNPYGEGPKLGLNYVSDTFFHAADGGATKTAGVYTHYTTNRVRFRTLR